MGQLSCELIDAERRIGPEKHAVIYCMRGDSLVNLLFECHESKIPSEWEESPDIEELRALFANWDPKSVFHISKQASVPSEQYTMQSRALAQARQIRLEMAPSIQHTIGPLVLEVR